MATGNTALLDPWYITGLVESAGAFTYSRTDRNLSLYFGLKVGADGGLLEDVRGYFGCGRIYRVKRGPTDGDPPGIRADSYYRVCRLDELDLVIEHFDAYPLRGKKANSYRIWREMVVLKRESYRNPDRDRLSELCAALSATSTRRGSAT